MGHSVHSPLENRGPLQVQEGHQTSQSLRKFRPGLMQRAGATEGHVRRRTAAEDRPGHTPASGRLRTMEQRLAEFREARKRASLVAQPSTSSQSVQTSGAKAEPAAATPKTATGWLTRFLKRKANPAIAQAQPNQPQVRREACTLKLRLRTGATPLPAQATPRISGSSLSCALSPRLPRGWTPHFRSVYQHMIRGLDVFHPRQSYAATS